MDQIGDIIVAASRPVEYDHDKDLNRYFCERIG